MLFVNTDWVPAANFFNFNFFELGAGALWGWFFAIVAIIILPLWAMTYIETNWGQGADAYATSNDGGSKKKIWLSISIVVIVIAFLFEIYGFMSYFVVASWEMLPNTEWDEYTLMLAFILHLFVGINYILTQSKEKNNFIVILIFGLTYLIGVLIFTLIGPLIRPLDALPAGVTTDAVLDSFYTTVNLAIPIAWIAEAGIFFFYMIIKGKKTDDVGSENVTWRESVSGKITVIGSISGGMFIAIVYMAYYGHNGAGISIILGAAMAVLGGAFVVHGKGTRTENRLIKAQCLTGKNITVRKCQPYLPAYCRANPTDPVCKVHRP